MLIADLLLLETMFHMKINIIRQQIHGIRRLGPQQLLSVAARNVFVFFVFLCFFFVIFVGFLFRNVFLAVIFVR
jgi:hypothetical protein